jgi:hypothetical protein
MRAPRSLYRRFERLDVASPPPYAADMKWMKFLFLTSPVVLLAGCATSWPVYTTRLSAETIRQDKTHVVPLTLAVKAAQEIEFRQARSVPSDGEWIKPDMQAAVSNLVVDLRKTGLFKTVIPWTPEARFDVLVESRRASGTIRCGTPFMLQPFTLYLCSAEAGFTRTYEFRFVGPESISKVVFNRSYTGSYYSPSILFLPFLSWQKRTTESDLLRHDLRRLIGEVQRLKSGSES